MAVRVETEREKKGLFSTVQRRVAAGVVAGTIAFGGFAVYQAIQSNNEPSATPIPGGIVEPSSSPTPTLVSPGESIVIPSQTPETSPSPTPDMSKWYNQIPENPYKGKSVNDIPLAKDSFGNTNGGILIMNAFPYKPYYAIDVVGPTIVKVIPEIKQNYIWVEVATEKPGTKITKEGCKIVSVNSSPDINFCNIDGPVLWLKITQNTFTYNYSGSKTLGAGLQNLAKTLKVGDSIKGNFGLGLAYAGQASTKADIAMNIRSWNNLNNLVGSVTPRTDAPNMQLAFQLGDLFTDITK
jgi:hypothetical protein